jgi:thiol-disulfide isomerase/thioredoxin
MIWKWNQWRQCLLVFGGSGQFCWWAKIDPSGQLAVDLQASARSRRQWPIRAGSNKESNMKTVFSSILLCLCLAANGVGAKTPGEVEVGAVLREATMQGLTGPSRKLSEFRGKPLIINVWASWCGPCQQEMSSLERLAHRAGQRFTVIGISTDDYPQAALAFLKKYKTSFSHFIDSRLLLENMLGADHLPLTLLIDAQGRVLAKFYGIKEWDSAQARDMIGKAFHLKM